MICVVYMLLPEGECGLPVFLNAAGAGYFEFFGILLHGVFLIVFNGFEQSVGILFFLLLFALLLLLLLFVLIVLLVFRLVLLIVLLVVFVLVLLVLLVVLAFVALFVLLVLVVLAVVALLLLLLLLLLGLLQHFEGIGEVVAGVVVLGVEFEGFLVVVYGLFELVHSFGAVFFFQSGLEIAVALVVEDTAAGFVVKVLLLDGLFEVLCGLLVFFLTVERVAQIVVCAVGGAVVVQCTAIVHLGFVVALRPVFAVAFAGLLAGGAALCRRNCRQKQ